MWALGSRCFYSERKFSGDSLHFGTPRIPCPKYVWNALPAARAAAGGRCSLACSLHAGRSGRVFQVATDPFPGVIGFYYVGKAGCQRAAFPPCALDSCKTALGAHPARKQCSRGELCSAQLLPPREPAGKLQTRGGGGEWVGRK